MKTIELNDIKNLKPGQVIAVRLRDIQNVAMKVNSGDSNTESFNHYFDLEFSLDSYFGNNSSLPKNPYTLLGYAGDGQFKEYYTNQVVGLSYIDNEEIDEESNKNKYEKFDLEFGHASNQTCQDFMKNYNKFLESPFYFSFVPEHIDAYEVDDEIKKLVQSQAPHKQDIAEAIEHIRVTSAKDLMDKFQEAYEKDYIEAKKIDEMEKIRQFVYSDQNKKA